MFETKTILLHLTDLHFGNNLSKSISIESFSYNDIAKLIALTIKENHTCNKLMIALGGDITNKGAPKKYQYAHEFITTIKDNLKDIELDYILCPGNHDVEKKKENWFSNFNIFSGELTGTQSFIYNLENTTVLYEKWGYTFITVNSTFHGNHVYGYVDINFVDEKLKASKKPIILLVHHHLIPVFREDISTIRNSYNLLRLCEKYKVKLILHGHIHSAFKLSYGNKKSKTTIIGCGATLPEIGTNYNNQFNIVELNSRGINRVFSYRIIYDSHKSYQPQTIKTIL